MSGHKLDAVTMRGEFISLKAYRHSQSLQF